MSLIAFGGTGVLDSRTTKRVMSALLRKTFGDILTRSTRDARFSRET